MFTVELWPFMSWGGVGKIQFTIKRWAAWMPEAQDRQDWLAWSERPLEVLSQCESSPDTQKNPEDTAVPKPAVDQIPPILRRRFSPLGKMAASVAWPLLEDGQSIPSVFCSRHGELTRTVDMLQNLALREDLSPTHFSLSVHNAIGGVFSIARKDTAPISALACGDDGVCQGLLETALILSESDYSEALCVFYDAPIPEVYGDTATGPSFPYAAAFVIGLQEPSESGEGELGLDMEMQSTIASSRPASLKEPQVLSFIRFLLMAEKTSLRLASNAHAWTLAKRAGAN